MNRLALSLSLVLGALALPSRADACGCFALPSPATPVVQAGERILFAHDGNDVIAYIQISYQGQANEFGWLVPLPSVPTLDLGSDLLFTALEQNTQPQYQLSTKRLFCSGGSSTTSAPIGGCGGASENGAYVPQGIADAGIEVAADMGASPVVERSSIGPYDYAVLKADDSNAMFQWLSDNRYFVPSGTMNAVTPYIHPGAYFLALKLHAGETAGDIQPIVLRYTSDLPMIPLILTSVGAIPNMGIEVFELGEARAIPRNYRHIVLNETSIWFGADYNALLIRAVQEAPMHHAFVTEYAGTSSVMQNAVWSPGRYGDPSILRTFTQPGDYLQYLVQYRYTLDATLLAILAKYIPEPQNLIDSGITPQQFYRNFGSYGGYQEPAGDGGVPQPFDPNGCTDEIVARILTPLQNTQALLDAHPYLTRLYTRLSPEDMTADPVFSENLDLPNVARLRTATVTLPCNSTRSWIDTDQGFTAQYTLNAPPTMPATLRLETLRDSGAPSVEQDNTQAIKDAIGPVSMDTSGSTSDRQGCQVDGRQTLDATLLLVIAGAILSVRARRRYSMRNNPRF